jgi:hypothetical protein
VGRYARCLLDALREGERALAVQPEPSAPAAPE